ncbi:MAG: hypothetical protein QHJ73_17205, partial [Armatimonadota bacterium]|nr:hypothetical protein [Armatimonadota bacterium]
AERVELTLNGIWQVARYDDPNMDAAPYEPVRTLPNATEYPLRWMGVAVPSNAWNKAELHFGHRLVYRTRVAVPASMRGHSFVLRFFGTNWIVSVFLNGKLMGTHKGVLIPWDLDVTSGVLPGQTNEIAIAVKSPWYAFDTEALKSTLEQERNRPNDSERLRWARWVAPIYPSTKGEGDGTAYGLVNPVKLVAAGPVYVADAFVRTSVARKRLDAEVTLANPGPTSRTVTLECTAIHTRSGKAEQSFPPVTVTVPAGSSKRVLVGGAWVNPKLWWPVENPDLYALRSTVRQQGQPLDVHHQRFGFREITLDGPRFRLNGVIRNFWNWVEVSGNPATPQEFLAAFRSEGNRFYRFAHDSILRRWFPYRYLQLDFCDRNGIPGRLSTCIDGMFINYNLRNPKVWENFAEHLEQMARAWRNHPSILFYSVENELLYINGQNVFGRAHRHDRTIGHSNRTGVEESARAVHRGNRASRQHNLCLGHAHLLLAAPTACRHLSRPATVYGTPPAPTSRVSRSRASPPAAGTTWACCSRASVTPLPRSSVRATPSRPSTPRGTAAWRARH